MVDDFTTIHEAGDSNSEHQENYFLYPVDGDEELKSEVVDSVKALCDDLLATEDVPVEYYQILEWTPDEHQSIDEHPDYEAEGWDKVTFFNWVEEQYVEAITENGNSIGTHIPIRTNSDHLDQLSKSLHYEAAD
jgi:hypothetical protein